MKTNSSNPKVLIAIGVSVAGILFLTFRRCRSTVEYTDNVERFKLLKSPQMAPDPNAREFLKGLKFAINEDFDVKEYVTTYTEPGFELLEEVDGKPPADAVTTLLKNGATCIGKIVVDEKTGKDRHYGTAGLASYNTGGSAVAVAGQRIDFSIGIDTIGEVRIPASLCGIFGLRLSHGFVSAFDARRNSPSLDTVGIIARNVCDLHRAATFLLKTPRYIIRSRRIIVADDLFQLHKVSLQKTADIVGKVLSDCNCQAPTNMNIGQYIMSNVPALNYLCEQTSNPQNETITLKALSYVMLLLQSYESKTNHEERVNAAKPKLSGVYERMHAEITATDENIKACYKVMTEMRAALCSVLQGDGILIIPTITGTPLNLKSERVLLADFHDWAYLLLSISTMSGCCQVTIPFDKHEEDCSIGVSFIASHGADAFLLDTLAEMYY